MPKANVIHKRSQKGTSLVSATSLVASGSTPTSGTEFFIDIPAGLIGLWIDTYSSVQDSNGGDVQFILQDSSNTDIGLAGLFSRARYSLHFFSDPGGYFQIPTGDSPTRLRVYCNDGGTFTTAVPYRVMGA